MSKETKNKEKAIHCACAPGDISGNALAMAKADEKSSTAPLNMPEPNATLPKEKQTVLGLYVTAKEGRRFSGRPIG